MMRCRVRPKSSDDYEFDDYLADTGGFAEGALCAAGKSNVVTSVMLRVYAGIAGLAFCNFSKS